MHYGLFVLSHAMSIKFKRASKSYLDKDLIKDNFDPVGSGANCNEILSNQVSHSFRDCVNKPVKFPHEISQINNPYGILVRSGCPSASDGKGVALGA
jgi:hypothetical protein